MRHFKNIAFKIFFFKAIFLLIASSCYSQNKFSLNSLIGDQVVVLINGKQYSVDSVGTKIPTNYPKFDTLVFKTESPGANTPIICNFKPDTAYSISAACCGSLDILPTSKLKNDSLMHWDFEKDFDKIQNQLMDKPFISVRTKQNPNDSIYAWHADAACKTKHEIINTKLWQLGIPPKCFYWNNITTIMFFKQDDKLPKHEESDLEELLEIDNIVELTSLQFRLFDNQRFVVIFDEKNNTATLEYE